MTLLINYCRSQDASPQVEDMLDNHLYLLTPSFLIDSSLSLSSPTTTSNPNQMTYLHVSVLPMRARSFIINKYPMIKKKNEKNKPLPYLTLPTTYLYYLVV